MGNGEDVFPNKKSGPDSFVSNPDFVMHSGLLLIIVIQCVIPKLTLKGSYVYRITFEQKSRP